MRFYEKTHDDELMFEYIDHRCANCNNITVYKMSKDLNYKVEEPFLCCEICLDEYADLMMVMDEPEEDEILESI